MIDAQAKLLRLDDTRSDRLGRWAALLGGVVNPVAFVAAYTVAGALRPGYSPIHQAISDLGVGRYGPVMDAIATIHGLLLVVFAAGFATLMGSALGPGRVRLATALLVVRGLAGMTTASFTEAPATVAVHSLATIVAVLSLLSAFLVVGRSEEHTSELQSRRDLVCRLLLEKKKKKKKKPDDIKKKTKNKTKT